MLVSQTSKMPDVTLKLVANGIKTKLAETRLKALDISDVTENITKTSALEAVQPLATKFTITFSYQQQLHRTKVNVSDSNYGLPIYKVALNSRLSNKSRVCWLQNTTDGWVILLGDTLDSSLVKAITSAIEDQQ